MRNYYPVAGKFGRNYYLLIQLAPPQILSSFVGAPSPFQPNTSPFLTVTLPLTIEFDVHRTTLSSNSHASFRIYNLSIAHRSAIQFNYSNYGTYRRVIFQAGYGGNTPTVFQGNITQAWSVREGVNFITTIECQDAGFAFRSGQTSKTYPASTSQLSVLSDMVKNGLPNISLGAIGPSTYTDTTTDTPYILPTAASYSGSTYDQLVNLTNGAFFSDLEVGHCLGPSEYIASGAAVTVSPSSGLLDTPVIEQTLVRFNMLFEPSLKIGYPIQLNSFTNSAVNGKKKITAVHHRGTISDAVCGDAVTLGEFSYFNDLIPVSLAS